MKRILSFLLSVVMVFTVITPTLTADIFATVNDPAIDTPTGQITPVEGESYIVSETHSNPLFRSNAQDTYTSEEITYVPPTVYASSNTLMTEAEAKQYIFEQIKAKKESFTLQFRSQTNYDGYSIDLALSAMAHTGVPDEGDYLFWQFDDMRVNGNYSYVGGGFNYSVTYTVSYFTTLEQEAQVDAAVAELLASADLSNATDYEKIYVVYKWMCDNIVYDYDNLYNDDYVLKHSAYAAIINHKAVCQGYAVLFYRLMLELGIDCRVITGYSNDQYHAWNIVKLDGVYYNVDTTWDAGYVYYDYFLRCDANFTDHDPDEDYFPASFFQNYPMATSDYVAPEWLIVDGVLLQYNGQDTDVVIPDGVIGIADYVFYGKNITSVVIPEGVQYIDVEAFANCENLTTVSLPSTLQYIFYGAFRFSGIKEIVLPESVLLVDEFAFYLCRELESITFLSSDTLIYDDYYTIFNGTTIKGYSGSSAQAYAEEYDRAFIDLNDKCGGNHTFGDYESISDTQHIRYCIADNGCAVFEVSEHVYDHNHDEECNNCGYIREVDYSTIDSGNCGDNLTWHLSAEGVLTISGSGKMTDNPWSEYADQILSIIIEPGVTTTASFAFSKCSNLTSVSLPESLTIIGDRAFGDCTSLEKIVMPKVKEIGNGAFSDCTSLKTIVFSDSLTTVEPRAFDNCSALETVVIPNSLTAIGDYMFSNCTKLKNVVLHDSITSIGGSAFEGCTALEYIDIPDSVTSIGGYCFNGCTSLKAIVIPEGVTEIYGYTFMNCKSLESVLLPSSITTIRNHVFMKCTSLTDIDIPDGVTMIEVFAFADTGLTSITIPESVKRIESSAFSDCPNLETITILSRDVDIYAYGCIPTTTTIYGYEGSTAQAYAETNGNEFVIICEGNHVFGNWVDHNSTQHKGECINAFCDGEVGYADHVYDDSLDTDCNDCGHIRVVILASGETAEGAIWTVKSDGTMSISGNGALTVQDAEAWSEYSSNITSVTVSGITSIGDGVFNGCTSLQSITIKSADITIPDSETAIPAGTTIYGYADSTAQAYAETYGRTFIEIPPVMSGDVNGDDTVDKNDAIYLLYSVLFGDTQYPLNQPCDFNADGTTDKNDAIYLLYHALFGAGSYPLN